MGGSSGMSYQMRDDGFEIERALIENALPREYAKTAIMWPASTVEIYFWRSHGWPAYGVARVFYGKLWVDSLGIVHPEDPPKTSNVVPRTGWVVTIDERAQTEVGDFGSVLDVLAKPDVRRRLGLPIDDEADCV